MTGWAYRPRSVSSLLMRLRAMTSKECKLQKVNRTDRGLVGGWKRCPGQHTITSLCGKEKRTSKRRLLREGKSGRNRFFTAQYYWLIPPQPDDTSDDSALIFNSLSSLTILYGLVSFYVAFWNVLASSAWQSGVVLGVFGQI